MTGGPAPNSAPAVPIRSHSPSAARPPVSKTLLTLLGSSVLAGLVGLAEPAAAATRAVVVGIDGYTNIRRLNGAENDAKDIAAVLRKHGIALSDRRAVKVQRLLAAAAVMAGREHPTAADLWPIVTAVPTREGQAAARDALRDVLARSENGALAAAAAEASLGPLARAARIAAAGVATLAERPAPGDAGALEAWRLKLEGVAREIDAGFTPAALPAKLAEVRADIVAALAG